MRNVARKFKVKDLKKVDITFYTDGDIFLTDNKIGILNNGKIEEVGKSQSKLKDYVKKKDIKGFITKNEIQKMIDKTIEESKGDE